MLTSVVLLLYQSQLGRKIGVLHVLGIIYIWSCHVNEHLCDTDFGRVAILSATQNLVLEIVKWANINIVRQVGSRKQILTAAAMVRLELPQICRVSKLFKAGLTTVCFCPGLYVPLLWHSHFPSRGMWYFRDSINSHCQAQHISCCSLLAYVFMCSLWNRKSIYTNRTKTQRTSSAVSWLNVIQTSCCYIKRDCGVACVGYNLDLKLSSERAFK